MHTHAGSILHNPVTLTFDLWPLGQRMPRSCHRVYVYKFHVDSSTRFPFTARTHTQSQTSLIALPTPAIMVRLRGHFATEHHKLLEISQTLEFVMHVNLFRSKASVNYRGISSENGQRTSFHRPDTQTCPYLQVITTIVNTTLSYSCTLVLWSEGLFQSQKRRITQKK